MNLIPDKVDDTSLETVFKDFIQGIVVESELRKCFRSKLIPVKLSVYLEKMNNFLRSCHSCFQKFKVYYNCESSYINLEEL